MMGGGSILALATSLEYLGWLVHFFYGLIMFNYYPLVN